MPDWDQFRQTADRVHGAFDFPDGNFVNWTQGTYDPDTGQIEGEWAPIGTASVELVPPEVDSTTSADSGSDLGFDTSLRAPESELETLSGDIVPYGEDSEKPTRVVVEGTEYEVQGNAPEHGSGMVLLRVTEL